MNSKIRFRVRYVLFLFSHFDVFFFPSFVSQFVFLDVFQIVFSGCRSLGATVVTRMLFIALWLKVESLNTHSLELDMM